MELMFSALVLSCTFLCSAYINASFMKKAVAEIHTPSIEHVPSSSPGSSVIYQFLSRGRIVKPENAV